ncbi:uncharacterized protein F4807DRAFT_458854 [Annulohypoxylon truncatum]|uniref:uncharacterized protein n=1 Tax=Annulohypoxylon truncatum TaxID=327061 RepID=UPI0020086F1E|nr:uncharacterized protein F4807DRAFT_458854 [Annulohypoxylon truncatum]KAI1211285.1 hypothetical protein F4807DRAFT_458854 [Annulohypoxylon truncatum]
MNRRPPHTMDKMTQTDEVTVLQGTTTLRSTYSFGFSYFKELPPELRAMVWRIYFLDIFYENPPHIHVLLDWGGPKGSSDRIWARTMAYRTDIPISTFLASTNELCYHLPLNISREAYCIAKKIKLPTSYPPRLDWSEDLIYCASSDERAAICFLRDNYDYVQNLAITMHQGHLSLLKLRLREFKSIKRLYFVVQPNHPVTTNKPRDKYGFIEWDTLYGISRGSPGSAANNPHFQQWLSGSMILRNGPVTAKVVIDVDYHRYVGPGYGERYRRLPRPAVEIRSYGVRRAG